MRSFLIDPFAAAFMARALAQTLLLAVLGGVVGVHIVLRRLAFVTEALQHTIFPGIAIAYVLGASLLTGALAAAALTVAVLVAARRLASVDQDGLLAVLIAGAFALGVVVVSRSRSYQHDLTVLLFGRILTVDDAQLRATAMLTALALVVLGLLHKELVMAAFDEVGAVALGLRPALLDLVIQLVVAVVVVAAVRAVGTVLVVAFLVTPAAAARLAGRGVVTTMAMAVGLSALCGWFGLALSYELSVNHGISSPTGATIVAMLTGAFVLAAGTRAIANRVRRVTPA